MCDLVYLDHISLSLSHISSPNHMGMFLSSLYTSVYDYVSISRPKTHPYAHVSSLQSYAYGMHPDAYGSKSTCSRLSKNLGACSLESKMHVFEIVKHFENFKFDTYAYGSLAIRVWVIFKVLRL